MPAGVWLTPDGEVVSACVALAQAVGLVLSTQSSMLLEIEAQAVVTDLGRGPLWPKLLQEVLSYFC